ncbi:MAG TPA: BON domain-containing protein, partial [Luteimonas sp.]|nr:BON domain-containing protein [Luteimonas sp.]
EEAPMRHEGLRNGSARTDRESVARTTASDLKTVAEDMLRMGRHWARAAQGWLERAGDEAQRTGQAWSRSDRDLRSDYGGDGYDQVDARRGSRDHDARDDAAYAAYGIYGTDGQEQAGRDFGGRDYRGVGPADYTRSDERIREDLNERLTEAHDLDASGLSVEVEGGVATLRGRVPQRWMKHRAEDLADGCIGVTDIRNHIVVGDGTSGTSASKAASGANTASASANADAGAARTSSTGGAPTGPGKATPNA